MRALVVFSLLLFPLLGESSRTMLHFDHQLGSAYTESNSVKINLDKGNSHLLSLKLMVPKCDLTLRFKDKSSYL